ncbi:hypothetical protein GOBAR_AA18993 [Gossypium barbadense]|uniref:Uncharacterized protein n=1 Tax=Gossypium barbadense TaxID=3634 RepID=A0A2P5XEA0_GOSBA|nr:hypothetical protein GOBAR_AA18993 [Gossypium barbadense]
MSLRLFALDASSQGKSGRSNINLLTVSTDHRIIVDTSVNRSSRSGSSKNNSVSHEINEAMNIDSVINGVRKKRKISARAIRIASTSEDEGNSAQLEQCSKRRVDPISPIPTAARTPSSSVTCLSTAPIISLQLPLIGILPHLSLMYLILYLFLEKLYLEVMENSLDFYLEEDLTVDEDVAPSAENNDVAPLAHVDNISQSADREQGDNAS